MLNKIQKALLMAEYDPAGKSTAVALSGGPDSVALMLAGKKLGWNVTALHCNFGLRGEESKRDELFVKELCSRLRVRLITVRFNVARRRSVSGESIEMACRSLRYEWFDLTARREGFDAVMLGHQLDDDIETFMLNALRGCGIKGIGGIPPRRGIYIRPMLGVTRREVLDFLSATGFGYIVDSSNLSNDFRRNKLRNAVLPHLSHEFPDYRERFERTLANLKADYQLMRSLIEPLRKRYTLPDGAIDVRALAGEQADAPGVLYHILDSSLDRPTVESLIRNASASGKYYTTDDGRSFLLDRGRLVPVVNTPESKGHKGPEDVSFTISTGQRGWFGIARFGGAVVSGRFISREEFHPERDASRVWLDADRLDFSLPFTLRSASTGDRFRPFGIRGSRLVSDQMAQSAVPDNRKSDVALLTYRDRILWVAGLRASSLYPVTASTVNILELHIRYSEKK